MNRRPSFHTIAIVLVTLLLPLTLLAGAITAAVYKSINPDNVDITASLAYLRETMMAGIAMFTVITVIIVGLIIKIHHHEHKFAQAKLPLALLTATITLIVSLMIVNSYTNSVQDQYLRDNNRATLDEFFDAVEQQKEQ